MSQFSPTRTLITTVATVSLAAGAIAPVATAAPAEAGACSATELVGKTARFDWNLRDSWVSYIHSPIARGNSAATGDVQQNGEGRSSSWTFNSGAATIIDEDSVEIPVQGSLQFQGHETKTKTGYILENKFSNFLLKLDGTEAKLVTDVQSREYINTITQGELRSYPEVVLSEWTLTKPFAAKAGQVELATDGQGTFTSEGLQAFGGFYEKGNDHTSPLTGSVSIAECEEPTTPQDPEQPEQPEKPEQPAPSAEPSASSSSDIKDFDILGVFGGKDNGFIPLLLSAIGAAGVLALIGHVAMNNPWVKR